MNKKLLVTSILISALTACSLAPEFKNPEITLPSSFKEDKKEPEILSGVWKMAEPSDKISRGEWWKIFDDAELDKLENEAAESNQSLKAAVARVQQAKAEVKANATSFLPDINLGANAVRSKPSSASAVAFGGPAGVELKPYTLYEAQGIASYEADIFGRVRNNERFFGFLATAEESNYQSALLSLQSDVAQTYFSLRAIDGELILLRDALGTREEALRQMQSRLKFGDIGEIDLAQAQNDLATVSAELKSVEMERNRLEHAMAVLLGKNPSEYSFDAPPLSGAPPAIPPGLPSSLLERRPDISAAQSSMAAANAKIGVARTAFFPSLMLTASGGFSSNDLSDIFKWPSRTWALGQLSGMALSLPIFNNGRDYARVTQADAAYNEAVANYQQQVLVAFGDVEDTLSYQNLLFEQSREQNLAAATAQKATYLMKKRYEQGDVDYSEVVNAERVSLAAERAAIQNQKQRFIVTVGLIHALGGGWNESRAKEETTESK